MARFYFTLLSLILMFHRVSAQETHGIEPAVIEISYSIKQLDRYDNFILRCGKNISQYFSLYRLKSQDIMYNGDRAAQLAQLHAESEALKHRNDPTKQLPCCTGHMDYIYRNLEQGKTSIYTQILANNYLVIEDNPVQNWEIQVDSVQSILGYECIKASCHFRGRTWVAWFASDIPLSLGPWKLSGLPGLILKVESKGFMTMEATNIVTNGLKPVTFYNLGKKKYERISREKFLKKKYTPGIYPKTCRIITMELDIK